MLKYALYRNHLTKGEHDYTGVPQSLENKKIEDIIHQITVPGSILKETECVAVIHDFFKAISTNLKEGYGFISEYIRIQPTISGVFNGVNDQFDPQRHQVLIGIIANGEFKDAVGELILEKVAGKVRQPEINSVYDLKSQQSDAVLTSGHMIEVRGAKLKFDNAVVDEGVFLINMSDNSEVKIAQVHVNLPGKLFAMLPDNLPAGSYSLEIRNRLNGIKNLVRGNFTKKLIVNSIEG